MERIDGIRLPDGKNHLKSDGSGLVMRHHGVLVTPETGFVIKTKCFAKRSLDRLSLISKDTIDSTYNNQTTMHASDMTKFFINVCYHDILMKPHMQRKLDDDGKEVEGLNVPISIGKTRACLDKSGSRSCIVVDVILSSKVRTQIEEDTSFRDLICGLVIQSVEQKCQDIYGNLDRQYKLPKTAYYGYLDSKSGDIIHRKSEHSQILPQWVKDYNAVPVIEDLGESKASILAETSSSTSFKTNRLTHNRSIDDLETEPVWVDISYRIYLESSSNEKINLNSMTEINRRALSDPALWMQQPTASNMPKFFFVNPALLENMSERIETLVVEVTMGSSIDFHSFQVELSTYQAFFACENFAPFTVTLPFAVIPSSSSCIYSEDERTVQLKAFIVHDNFSDHADCGTPQWTLQQVISTNDRCMYDIERINTNINLEHKHAGDISQKEYQTEMSSSPSDFDAILPEDRFHSQDAVSMFHLSQHKVSAEEAPSITRDDSLHDCLKGTQNNHNASLVISCQSKVNRTELF